MFPFPSHHLSLYFILLFLLSFFGSGVPEEEGLGQDLMLTL